MDYVSGCVGKRRSRLRRYFQSLDVINYYSSRCLAEMIRYPTPLPFLFPRISAGLGLGARAFPCTRGYATANNISLLCCVQKLYDVVVFQKRLLCHRKKPKVPTCSCYVCMCDLWPGSNEQQQGNRG